MNKENRKLEELDKIKQYVFKNSLFLNDKYKEFEHKNIEEFYFQIPCISKDEIAENLELYLDKNFLSLFDSNIIDFITDITDLSENHDKQIKDNFNNIWTIETTSGSMGKPLPIVKSQFERLKESKYLLKCRKQHFENANLSNGLLLIHKNDPNIKKIDYREDSNQFKYVIESMLLNNPKWIFSSTRIFNRFIDYIIKSDLQNKFESCDIRFIETTSQKMLKEEIIQSKSIFDCDVISNYGCREVWNIAYECKNHHLHLNNDLLIVDVVDEDGNIITEDGKVGDIVITSLVHQTMPLIKYYIGDRGRIYRNLKLCDNDSPILILEDGREYEKIKGTEYYGTTIFRKVLRTLYFHYHIIDIERIRIIQNKNTFHIYVEKKNLEETVFEKAFINVFYDQIKYKYKFKFIFHYYFPFSNNNLLYKEKIFSSEEKILL